MTKNYVLITESDVNFQIKMTIINLSRCTVDVVVDV